MKTAKSVPHAKIIIISYGISWLWKKSADFYVFRFTQSAKVFVIIKFATRVPEDVSNIVETGLPRTKDNGDRRGAWLILTWAWYEKYSHTKRRIRRKKLNWPISALSALHSQFLEVYFPTWHTRAWWYTQGREIVWFSTLPYNGARRRQGRRLMLQRLWATNQFPLQIWKKNREQNTELANLRVVCFAQSLYSRVRRT